MDFEEDKISHDAAALAEEMTPKTTEEKNPYIKVDDLDASLDVLASKIAARE